MDKKHMMATVNKIAKRVYKQLDGRIPYKTIAGIIMTYVHNNSLDNVDTIDWLAFFETGLEKDELLEEFKKAYPHAKWEKVDLEEIVDTYEDMREAYYNGIIEDEKAAEEARKELYNKFKKELEPRIMRLPQYIYMDSIGIEARINELKNKTQKISDKAALLLMDDINEELETELAMKIGEIEGELEKLEADMAALPPAAPIPEAILRRLEELEKKAADLEITIKAVKDSIDNINKYAEEIRTLNTRMTRTEETVTTLNNRMAKVEETVETVKNTMNTWAEEFEKKITSRMNYLYTEVDRQLEAMDRKLERKIENNRAEKIKAVVMRHMKACRLDPELYDLDSIPWHLYPDARTAISHLARHGIKWAEKVEQSIEEIEQVKTKQPQPQPVKTQFNTSAATTIATIAGAAAGMGVAAIHALVKTAVYTAFPDLKPRKRRKQTSLFRWI
jgi:methyl-accepting chemotaxis protein